MGWDPSPSRARLVHKGLANKLSHLLIGVQLCEALDRELNCVWWSTGGGSSWGR